MLGATAAPGQATYVLGTVNALTGGSAWPFTAFARAAFAATIPHVGSVAIPPEAL